MAKNWAIIFGVVFVVIGLLAVLGWGDGIVGPTGLFMTNSLHDWVHIITGLIFLIVAFASPMSSAGTMKVFGIIYLIVGVLGFTSILTSLLALNTADTWLHLVLGVVITWAGFSTGKKMGAPMMTS